MKILEAFVAPRVVTYTLDMCEVLASDFQEVGMRWDAKTLYAYYSCPSFLRDTHIREKKNVFIIDDLFWRENILRCKQQQHYEMRESLYRELLQ